MPTRPGHICAPGCPVIVPAGTRRCPTHTVAKVQYVDERRGTRHERGYGTPWEKKREAWFSLAVRRICGARVNGPDVTDSLCLQAGVTSPGRVLDHIVRKRKGGADDESNYQTLCDHCHNVKRQKERRDP